MNKQEELREEYHEHPRFSGQYHNAVWVKTWASVDAIDTEPPANAYVSCDVCGRSYGN